MERWKWWRWGRWCWWLAWGWRDANTGWRVPWTGKPRRTWEFRQQASKSCVCWKISLTDNNENDNLILSNEKTLTTSPPASPRGRPARRRRRWKPRWRRGPPTPVFFIFIHFFIFHIFCIWPPTPGRRKGQTLIPTIDQAPGIGFRGQRSPIDSGQERCTPHQWCCLLWNKPEAPEHKKILTTWWPWFRWSWVTTSSSWAQ